MKRQIIFFAFLLIAVTLLGQVPEKMSYQAVIRDAGNNLIKNKSIACRISIISGSENGDVVYSETHNSLTNDNGLVSLIIGEGETDSNTLSTINWADTIFFIRTETDPTGGTNYTITGLSQFLSVPYALYAANEFSGLYNDLTDKPTFLDDKFNTSTGKNNLVLNVGLYNTSTGYSAMAANTSGKYNAAHGALALPSNTTGNYNSAFGALALYSNQSGYSNTANGYAALRFNTTGRRNTANGDSTLFLNTTGSNNTAVGKSALFSNSTGDENTSVGVGSLYSNKDGFNNTSYGAYAMYYNTTGFQNAANGAGALLYNSTGYSNTANGYVSLRANTTGNLNTAVGFSTLHDNTTGNENTAVGASALNSNITGYNNTAVGNHALYYNSEGFENVAIGANSLLNNTSNANTAVGYNSMASNTSGRLNTALGCYTEVLNNVFDAVAIGNGASVNADHSIRIGNNNIITISGQVAWSYTSDGRFKTNVKQNVPGLEFILKLKPVTFTWDIHKLDAFMGVNDSLYVKEPDMEKARLEKESKVYTGFIAQEVQKAAEECGYEFSGINKPVNDKVPYTLSYSDFVMPMVKAIQEQQSTIEILLQQNAEMKKEIEELKASIKE